MDIICKLTIKINRPGRALTMRNLLTIFGAFIALVVLLACDTHKRPLLPAKVKPYAVKTAAYWTSPTMDSRQAKNLAKHSLVIVDLENKFNNRSVLLELKQLNPGLKLLAYSNPMEIYTKMYNNRSWQNKVINEINEHYRSWLLREVYPNSQTFDYAEFWPGMVMLNLSQTCPKENGMRYNLWMARRLLKDILSDNLFDGYFIDNGTSNVSWMTRGQNSFLDINGSGRRLSRERIDHSWHKGMRDFLKVIRKRKGKDYIIVANKGDLNLLSVVDGKFFEKFPNDYIGEKLWGGWRQSMSNAAKTGKYSIINVDYADLDFGLASYLLLGRGYFSISQDDPRVFAELEDLVPGRAISGIRRGDGYYYRDYENVVARVWPEERKGEIIKK